ncbi:MAG TPA: mechanosensitive ion channel domain-containing protein [Casimicrobiaceae bacterium]|nr:mechanosensitive ion channel domain-containing protein [Casimicrobiaceae bacterium]
MLTPLDLERIQVSLRAPNGWIELGTIALCFAIAWAIDRRVHLTSERESRVARLGAGSLNRLIFPLAALALLYLARAVFRHWQVPAFFPIAFPLVVALALIRLLIYALRNVLGVQAASASERTLSFAIWGALLLYYVGVLPEIGAALDDTRIPIGKTEISVLDLGRDAIVVIVVVVLSLWASSLIEQRLMRGTHLDQNLRVVLAKVFRALLLLIGVLVALSFVGVDLTVLSVFGGAVGVGIGLGLQKLASNYIAGFTILLDRSIRLGDMITVDNRTGTVSVVSSRYVVVRGLDGVEAIVPNETLVTTTVLNHSYTSKDVKLGIPVQISYDSDLELAMRLMTELAVKERRVLQGPLAPVVNVLQFANNGIDLELAVWINDPEKGQGNLKTALNIAIWKTFRDNGIRIPFPQREVRIIGQLPGDKPDAPPAPG